MSTSKAHSSTVTLLRDCYEAFECVVCMFSIAIDGIPGGRIGNASSLLLSFWANRYQTQTYESK